MRYMTKYFFEFCLYSWFACSFCLSDNTDISCCLNELQNFHVGPIHQKRTLAFLNHFLIETTSFLNNFATVCDGKLEDMLQRIQRLESSICVLENKLASIPGLENAYQDSEPEQNTKQETKEADSEKPPIFENVITSDLTTTSQPAAVSEPMAAQATPNGVPYSRDPRYAKYFKMVNMGVPPGAVKLKMSAEGVDDKILDKPDEISPDSTDSSAPAKYESDENTDESSDFSD